MRLFGKLLVKALHPMKTLFTVPVLALLLAHIASAQSALVNKNIFPEGTFDVSSEGSKTPSGWTLPDPHDKPYKAGFIALVEKGTSGSKELKITRPEPTGATMVGTKFPLPPKIERLRISFRILAKIIELGEDDPAGNGVGLYARFYDADNKAIPGVSGWVGSPSKTADTEWQEHEQTYPVPVNATVLELHIIFRSASGEVNLDDVQIVPLSIIK